MHDLTTLAGTSAALETGAVSPNALLDSCVARIDALNPTLNAICSQQRDAARTAAQQSEARQRKGARLGPLDGVPFTVKDNLHAAGLPATWGSQLFADFIPPADDLCVARLRAAGGVLIGKTNTPEFALAAHTTNALFGATRNPWARDRVPAGSSGGAAAGVATGMSPLAIGTDAGGSIRLPAAFCGLTGFKPTVGRIPRLHGFPPIVLDFQAIGLMARDAAGLRLALELLGRPDARDRASLGMAPLSAPMPRAPRLRLLPDAPGEHTDPEVASRLVAAAEVFRELGCTVEHGPAPYALDTLRGFWSVLSPVGLYRVVRRFPDWRERVTPAMRALAEQGATIEAADYAEAIDAVNRYRAETAAAFEDFDLLLTPTCPTVAWPIETGPPASIAGHPTNPRTPMGFTTFVNVTGQPAISLPCGLTAARLPVGVQLVGKHGADALVLDLAQRFQHTTSWHLARPLEFATQQETG